ncbi:MAG: hypothetical protein BWY85_02182 [Firmicutes bacterium ADurb.Bin506]|nr:MAG: hypothetical protein BWY85_02182 [Firmicutes bacterium ADurb.Bin506]
MIQVRITRARPTARIPRSTLASCRSVFCPPFSLISTTEASRLNTTARRAPRLI